MHTDAKCNIGQRLLDFAFAAETIMPRERSCTIHLIVFTVYDMIV